MILGKHSGQLKRIAVTVITLIQLLLNLEVNEDAENIFYERFIQFSVADLNKINFYRHIGTTKNDKSKVILFPLERQLFLTRRKFFDG